MRRFKLDPEYTNEVLDDKLLRVQEAMERELKSITLADVNSDLGKYLEKVI